MSNLSLSVRVGCALGALALALLAGCTTPAPPLAARPDSPEATAYLTRAATQVQMQDQVDVRVAVLRDAESEAVFGLPLAEKGIQPVWVSIHNRSAISYWFLPVFLDKDFFSPREVAYLFHSGDDACDVVVERTLTRQQVKLHVPPGGVVSGFVYTNLTRGIKLVNIELAGPRKLLRFAFAREVPKGGFDYQSINPVDLYPRERIAEVSLHGLGAVLEKLICCTTSEDGKVMGDPLNLVFIGGEHDLLVTLVRGGWDFTETTNASSVGRMIGSAISGAAYRTSPVSALYFDGRKQDFAMQRARATISQRNHLRLWLAPIKVDGKPVWVGQVSRDIGVRITSKSPFLTTHKVDPDVDEAREYLLQDMLMSSGISRWGLAHGVGAATADVPRQNLTGDPYFTDGKRLVLIVATTPKAIPEIETIEWGR